MEDASGQRREMTEEGFIPLHPASPSEPNIFRVQDVDRMLAVAVENKASDVVFGAGESVWVRIHGQWLRGSKRVMVPTEVDELLNGLSRSPSSSAQTSSGMDLDFKYDVYVSRFSKLRFRVNATACQDERGRGVEITMRSIPGAPPSLDDMGVEEGILRCLYPIFGLVLVTGPVGSGKTTLLASALAKSAKTSPRRILTYESPVEFDLKSVEGRIAPVTQTEIPSDLVSGWAGAVRNSLRRAGDIVLFGESRDYETMAGMLQAAETGVSVYSTSHTNGVADTISRIADVFPWEERNGMIRKMISSLRLIVNQRLFPRMGGGRVAVREFLEFDSVLRKEVLNLPFEQIIPFLLEAVDNRGQSMAKASHLARERGEITDETLDSILQAVDSEAMTVRRKNERVA